MDRAAGWMIGLALGALAGCADHDAVSPVPVPVPTSTGTPLPQVDRSYATGMDIQYLDDDGQLRTLKVEDFPR